MYATVCCAVRMNIAVYIYYYIIRLLSVDKISTVGNSLSKWKTVPNTLHVKLPVTIDRCFLSRNEKIFERYFQRNEM